MPKKYKSCAVWPPGLGIQDNMTVDYHDTIGQAAAVCEKLEREGLGGERDHFPVRTWVAPNSPSGVALIERRGRHLKVSIPDRRLPNPRDNLNACAAILVDSEYESWAQFIRITKIENDYLTRSIVFFLEVPADKLCLIPMKWDYVPPWKELELAREKRQKARRRILFRRFTIS